MQLPKLKYILLTIHTEFQVRVSTITFSLSLKKTQDLIYFMMDCIFRIIMAQKCNMLFGQLSKVKLQDPSSKKREKKQRSVLLMHTYLLIAGRKLLEKTFKQRKIKLAILPKKKKYIIFYTMVICQESFISYIISFNFINTIRQVPVDPISQMDRQAEVQTNEVSAIPQVGSGRIGLRTQILATTCVC